MPTISDNGGISTPPLKTCISTNNSQVDFSQSAPWNGWFRDIFNNLGFDNNHYATWTPTFTGLGTTGTINITGQYFKYRKTIWFEIVISSPVPSSPVTTTSILNTTYCNNLPFKSISYGGVNVIQVSTLTGSIGLVKPGENKVYLPSWTTNDNITITGSFLTNE